MLIPKVKMLVNKIDLFEYYCDIADLSDTKQAEYITQLRNQDNELANQLEALIKTNNDLTQAFTDSVLDLTDGHQFARVGDTLTNYQLTQSLGSGGMGQVFKAQRNDGKIEQTVAIKCLHPLFEQYQSGKLLLQEAQALANLSHPNIASIYDIAETDSGNTFIVMEYIEGDTLDVYLQKNTLSVTQKLKLFIKISDAVLEAHNHQIIHADIKPSNVLINASGQAKLIDFGVMQLTEDLNHHAPKFVTAYLGAMTVNYASPEQLNGAKATISSDIYGLGSLLYFMLSGSAPFEKVDNTLTHKIEFIKTQSVVDCVINGDVKFKADLIAIVNKALSKLPQERYRTVTDFMNDINAFLSYKYISTSGNDLFLNFAKLFYRYRMIGTSITSVFIILLATFFQINEKNELLNKEKKALESVNQELKNTFTRHDKSISEAYLKNEVIYLPDPNNLTSKQYIEMMMLMFDDYYLQQKKTAYSLVIETLIQWLSTQNNIDPLSFYLAKFRKVISENNNDKKEYIDILNSIITIQSPLSSEILKIFELKVFSAQLRKDYLLPLFLRLESELIKSEISIEELFLLYRAGGRLYMDNNLTLSVNYFKKAYQLAKENKTEVKHWLFIDTLFNLISQLRNLQGPTKKELTDLKNELHILITQIDGDKVFRSKLSLLLAFEVTFSMDSVSNILHKNKITFQSSLDATSFADAVMIRTQSSYFNSLGQYEAAVKLAIKAAHLKEKESGVNDNYYIYFIVKIAYIYLDSGDTLKAIKLIEELILPFIKEYESVSYLGYYQSQFCYKLALSEDTKYLQSLCFDGFNNNKKSLGIDNYWTKYAAGGLVAWYSFQPFDNKEEYYVELFEADFEEGSYQEKIHRGFILERYFISRKKIEKAKYYQAKLKNSIEGYYGTVDTIDRYSHKIMAAEIDLLQNDKTSAIAKLNQVNEKICGLSETNPQKIKYITLQYSLNQPACTP